MEGIEEGVKEGRKREGEKQSGGGVVVLRQLICFGGEAENKDVVKTPSKPG